MRSLIAALLLAACTSAPAPAVTHFPQAREPAEAEMQALARTTLALENGCLRLGGPDGALIIWPAESVLDQSGDAVRVRNGRTGVVLTAGGYLEMSGGFVDGVQAEALKAPLPAECPGPYWIAGSEWRNAPR